MNIRWKVACINWSHPDAPHAVSYALRDGEMVADQFHVTWDDAMERANWWAARTAERSAGSPRIRVERAS